MTTLDIEKASKILTEAVISGMDTIVYLIPLITKIDLKNQIDDFSNILNDLKMIIEVKIKNKMDHQEDYKLFMRAQRLSLKVIKMYPEINLKVVR